MHLHNYRHFLQNQCPGKRFLLVTDNKKYIQLFIPLQQRWQELTYTVKVTKPWISQILGNAIAFKEKANKGWENKTSNSDGNYVVVLRFGHVYWTLWWLVITQSTFINVITGINDFLSLTAKLLKTLSLRYWWWFLVRRWYLKS